jgi:hypothetical protein
MPKPLRIGVNDLIGASKQYLADRVKKANLDNNAYLTQAEAKKLPADLRDNYDTFRKAGHPRVSVKKFSDNFVKYVAVSARAADKNKDGVLTATEAKALPKDLRDNFLSYVKATTRPAVPTVTDLGRQALGDYVKNVLFNSGNPEGASFRSAIVDGHTPTEKAEIRRQMDAEVAAWSPTAPDWEKTVQGTTTTYSGRLFQLYTEVKFEAQKAPSVFVEID